MINKKSAQFIKEYISKNFPHLLEIIEKPYKSPKNYVKWDWEVLGYLGKSIDPFTEDKVSNYTINVCNCLIDYDFPTYYVSRQLALSLWNTECNLDANDLKIAQPSVLFMIPNNTIITPDGDSLTSVGIASSKKCNFLKKYYEKFGNTLFATSGFLDLKINKSYWYVIHNKSAGNKNYNEIESHYEEYLIKNNNIPQTIIEDYEKEFLDKYKSFCFNLMFVLEKRTELITQEGVISEGFGKNNKKEKTRSPIWLGKDYKIKYINRPESFVTGVKKSPHFRKGHYRRQRYGKDLKQEKIKWIDPVIVNVKNLQH